MYKLQPIEFNYCKPQSPDPDKLCTVIITTHSAESNSVSSAISVLTKTVLVLTNISLKLVLSLEKKEKYSKLPQFLTMGELRANS